MLQPTPFFLLVFALFTTLASAQTTPPAAETLLQQAQQQAAKENKKVFVIFHASWCGWCHRMDSLMNSATCRQSFTNNYVIEHITVQEAKDKKNLENPGGEALLNKYNGEGQGIPYWLIFDATGKLLADSRIRPEGAGVDVKGGDNTGCPSAMDEVNYFIGVLKRTSSLNKNQLQVIQKAFWMQ